MKGESCLQLSDTKDMQSGGQVCPFDQIGAVHPALSNSIRHSGVTALVDSLADACQFIIRLTQM